MNELTSKFIATITLRKPKMTISKEIVLPSPIPESQQAQVMDQVSTQICTLGVSFTAPESDAVEHYPAWRILHVRVQPQRKEVL